MSKVAQKYSVLLVFWIISGVLGLGAIPVLGSDNHSVSSGRISVGKTKSYGNDLAQAETLVLIDSNNDKIHDLFAEKLLALSPEDLVDVTVTFTRALTERDLIAIEAIGGILQKQYPSINACLVKANPLVISAMAQLPSVEIIEGLATTKATLMKSTQQIRVRPYVWDLGYQGNASQAIAILDTGIDASHPDFAGKISYWEDFTASAYIDPQDRAEHGTHVASIAAGTGANSTGTYYWETYASRTHVTEGSYFPHNIQIFAPGAVTINITWNNTVDSSTPYLKVGLSNGTAFLSSSFSTSPYSWNTPVMIPGNYDLIVENDADAGDRAYVGAIKIPTGLSNDNYAAHLSGVAPASKIVALKVLDDAGSGTSTDLLEAFTWLEDHGAAYNVTVVSMSLAFDSIYASIDNRVNHLVNEHGFVVVVAAGNDGSTSGQVNSPGSAGACICVGAVNAADQVAYYSSNGNWVHDPTGKPDILAPGGSAAYSGTNAPQIEILAADSSDEDDATYPGSSVEERQSDPYPGNYQQMQGTSMACPHVAGIAQLLIQAWPGGWTPSAANALKIKQILCMSAVEINSGETFGGSTQNPSPLRGTKDVVEGWGKVLADAALNMTRDDLQLDAAYSFTLAGGAINQKNFAGRLYLSNGQEYYFTLQVPTNLDADLYLYMPSADSYGDPVLCQKSTSNVSGQKEVLHFTANATGYFYLAAKYVSGSSGSALSLSLAQDLFIDVQNPLPGSGRNETESVDFNITVIILKGSFHSCWYSLDGGTNVTFSGNASIGLLSRNFHTVTFYANNSLGVEASTALITFYVRTTAPEDHLTLVVLHPTDGCNITGTLVDFNIEFSTDLGDLDKCWVEIDGVGNFQFSGNASISITPGSHWVIISANNTLGEQLSSSVIHFTVKAEPDWPLALLILAVSLIIGIGAVVAARRK